MVSAAIGGTLAPAARTGAVEARDVSKRFIQPDGGEVTALSSLNLTILPGEFVSLIGPSGCGKSTFLRLVAGLISVTAGTLALDGAPINSTGADRGLVFQDPTLFPWLSVRGNVAYGLKIRGVYKEKRGEIQRYIDLVGLTGFEKSYPHQLSGGMAQRASLARALVNEPKVLLLDEPLGALDAFTRMSMQDEILRVWRERGTTMIMVTHDVDEAIYMSDRVFVMTPRPAKIERVIAVEIGRDDNLGRSRDDPDFLRLRAEILRILQFAGKKRQPEYFL
ncbi:MAG: ABC transporter ATP-binding protein [Oscillospiraceae bacterium]|jgi:ABC-type nitrate/sulfonate/bicarbonate transport system ATPase subunit|nr:ABC transporter ATP-binding protein [Oscillospiraceae bacterium]